MLLEGVLAFVWLVYLWETYLDLRQRNKMKEDKLPKELVGVVSEEKFHKSRTYSLDKSSFGLLESLFSQLEGTFVLWLGGLPFLWNYSKNLALQYGFTEENEVTISLIFILLASVYEMLFHLPWELYSTFVIEQRHGFNKTTLGVFFSDKIKGLLLGILIGGPALSGILHIIKWGGDYFYLYTWAFIAVFTLFMLTIYPTVIAPLFNKFTPLQEGELRSKIEGLASRIAFPLTELYVVDGSKRSGHSNAYFYGFFKNKRIVMYDTLLEQLDQSEIVAVLGHELGHWKLNHTLKMFFIGQFHIFISFFLFGQILNWDYMYHSFGFDSKPTIIGLIIFFQFVMSPFDHLLSFFMNILSRKFEFQADEFGTKLGEGFGAALKSGLIKISQENQSNLNPDPWYSMYHYSHPPLVERLKGISATKND